MAGSESLIFSKMTSPAMLQYFLRGEFSRAPAHVKLDFNRSRMAIDCLSGMSETSPYAFRATRYPSQSGCNRAPVAPQCERWWTHDDYQSTHVRMALSQL